jgi:hypothetical protein
VFIHTNFYRCLGLGVSNPVRAAETFYVSQGVYNWSADAQGLYFLKAAADRGVPFVFLWLYATFTTDLSSNAVS